MREHSRSAATLRAESASRPPGPQSPASSRTPPILGHLAGARNARPARQRALGPQVFETTAAQPLRRTPPLETRSAPATAGCAGNAELAAISRKQAPASDPRAAPPLGHKQRCQFLELGIRTFGELPLSRHQMDARPRRAAESIPVHGRPTEGRQTRVKLRPADARRNRCHG